MYIENAINY